ncbi:hypothetical protein Cni_G14808 [Canna indica]|uniref:Uncharacterized protein n=1 Tax=Canna indica TaxID=4628 RepID=A0AAQ3QE61_9LILI|nr:hypothetical protein Cni_G14808 [Canna indica]
MAGERQRETLILGKKRPVKDEDVLVEDEEDEEREILELEREVSEMGRRIIDARRTIPNRLLEVFSSRILTQRPLLPPRAFAEDDAGETEMRVLSSESNRESFPTSADQKMHEKLLAFRAKTESNISAMPVILKRTNDCISKIEILEKCHVKVPSIFNRKST